MLFQSNPCARFYIGTDETKEKGQRAVEAVTAERLDSWFKRGMMLAAIVEAA